MKIDFTYFITGPDVKYNPNTKPSTMLNPSIFALDSSPFPVPSLRF